MISRFKRFWPETKTELGENLDAHTRSWRRTGWLLIVVFIGGGMLWAASTRLDAAAVGLGTVAVESNRKSIQHLEGGIIKEIHVREGDVVSAGQLLVTLDDTSAAATVELLQSQLDATLALQARLRAERDGSGNIEFPQFLLDRSDDPKVRGLLDMQMDVFESRRDYMADQVELLRRTREGERRKIEGYRKQIAANQSELNLLTDELAEMESAVRDGVVARTKYLAMKRKAASISAELAQNEAQLDETRKALAEVESQLKLPAAQKRSEVSTQLQAVEDRLSTNTERLMSERDILARTRIRAPQGGTIVDVQVHTAGGVIQPGQRLMDLVPEDDRLVIETRVDPKDMASVYKGMPARVMVSAFNPRTTPALEGKVVSVSADRIVDPATGISYFEARIVPDAMPVDGDAAFDLSRLMPGMQAQVFLLKEKRTVLDYIFEPLYRNVVGAGRES